MLANISEVLTSRVTLVLYVLHLNFLQGNNTGIAQKRCNSIVVLWESIYY